MKGVYSVTLTVEHVFGLTAAKVITALGPLLGEDLIFYHNVPKHNWDVSNIFVLTVIPLPYHIKINQLLLE